MIDYIVIAFILAIVVLLYISIARRFNIVDVPGHRSSHSTVTVRGAGVIFPLAAILSICAFGATHLLLIFPLILISVVSFVDDLGHINPFFRLMAQFVSVAVMLYAANAYNFWPLLLVVLLHIVIVGAINMFNFMDGINGITGIYSLVMLLSLCYLNYTTGGGLMHSAFFIYPAIASVVFLYFNLRGRERCFAGDVGSIGMAFWLCFLLVSLIVNSGNYKCIFLTSVYAADAGLTLIKRILLKENILEAHRKHLYQQLVNNGRFKHLTVAIAYGIIQLLINVLLFTTTLPFYLYLLLIGIPLIALYISLNFRYKLPAASISL